MENNTSFKQEVLEAIKERHVAMRPRWQFILAGVLAVIGGILIALVLLYLVSFIIFVLRQTGVGFVPSFGARGWFAFFVSLPWLLILFATIFVVILEILVRRYAFAYRRPLLYSVCCILALVIVGGFFVASTPLHRKLFVSAEEQHLPFGAPFYRGFGDREFGNIFRGRVVATTTEGFVLQGRRGPLMIIVTPQTQLPFDTEFLPGNIVVVFGDRSSSTIEAVGVRTIGE